MESITILGAIRGASTIQIMVEDSGGNKIPIFITRRQSEKLVSGRQSLVNWEYDPDERILTFIPGNELPNDVSKKIAHLVAI